MLYLAILKNTSTKFLDPGAEADDLHKFNQFFPVHRHISGIIFRKFRSAFSSWSC